MQDLRCKHTINLDGDESSALLVKDWIVNNIFGDIDENMGKKLERPVSDVIIFRKKNKWLHNHDLPLW